jgi:hypothetical protein
VQVLGEPLIQRDIVGLDIQRLGDGLHQGKLHQVPDGFDLVFTHLDAHGIVLLHSKRWRLGGRSPARLDPRRYPNPEHSDSYIRIV